MVEYSPRHRFSAPEMLGTERKYRLCYHRERGFSHLNKREMACLASLLLEWREPDEAAGGLILLTYAAVPDGWRSLMASPRCYITSLRLRRNAGTSRSSDR